MIVREAGSSFVLITQPDHARLAETLMRAVRTERALDGDIRETVLLATREHDNGWAEVDAEPTIDPATGRPCDFMSGPAAVKHELWLRGVTRAAREDPLAGALVAEHALTVYGYRRADPAWTAFFATIASMRDALLQRADAGDACARERFEAAYRCVRIGDSWSLQFCNGWTEGSTTCGYQTTLDGDELIITPDPFAGAIIGLRVLARRIPARRYADDAALRQALAATAPDVVAGRARGAKMG